MSEKITLEDINTWLLKYGELDAPKYSMPHVNVTGVLYRGNTNNIHDILDLPEGVEYTVYFENRPVNEIVLSEDYKDTCNIRIVTLSAYPYVNSDVRITIPVETKHLQTLTDLNNYDYGYVDSLNNIVGVIENDVHIILEQQASFNDCNLIFNANVTMEGELTVNNSFITNNSSLTFENVSFNASDEGVDYLIVNNGSLKIMECTIQSDTPFILDKGTLTMQSNDISCLTPNIAFIYLNDTSWNIQGNNIYYSAVVNYADFGVCFIRANTDDIDKLIADNNFNYDNVNVTIDNTDYIINGAGVCHARLDDDTIYVKNLEVV